ncbi:hypothetical protein F4819DRAFT_355686 [Hypoxylon fuscum]|nr:hypothetical protein F4819DRAFT_355686 [Hypoxylon fuscum]
MKLEEKSPAHTTDELQFQCFLRFAFHAKYLHTLQHYSTTALQHLSSFCYCILSRFALCAYRENRHSVVGIVHIVVQPYHQNSVSLASRLHHQVQYNSMNKVITLRPSHVLIAAQFLALALGPRRRTHTEAVKHRTSMGPDPITFFFFFFLRESYYGREIRQPSWRPPRPSERLDVSILYVQHSNISISELLSILDATFPSRAHPHYSLETLTYPFWMR